MPSALGTDGTQRQVVVNMRVQSYAASDRFPVVQLKSWTERSRSSNRAPFRVVQQRPRGIGLNSTRLLLTEFFLSAATALCLRVACAENAPAMRGRCAKWLDDISCTIKWPFIERPLYFDFVLG